MTSRLNKEDMAQLEVNDIVKLNPDSPEMTVINTDVDGYVYCTWVNSREDRMHGSFPNQILLKL